MSMMQETNKDSSENNDKNSENSDKTKNTDKNKIVYAFDYEISQNEEKRDIVVPQPAYLHSLLTDLQTVFNSPV